MPGASRSSVHSVVPRVRKARGIWRYTYRWCWHGGDAADGVVVHRSHCSPLVQVGYWVSTSLGVLGILMKRRANVYGEMTHASSPPSSPSAPSADLRNPSLLEVCMHGEKLSGNVGAPVSRFTSRFLLHPLAPFLIHWVARHSRMYEFGWIFSVFGSKQPSQMCS